MTSEQLWILLGVACMALIVMDGVRRRRKARKVPVRQKSVAANLPQTVNKREDGQVNADNTISETKEGHTRVRSSEALNAQTDGPAPRDSDRPATRNDDTAGLHDTMHGTMPERTPELPANQVPMSHQKASESRHAGFSEHLASGVQGSARTLSASCLIGSATAVKGQLVARESVVVKGRIQGTLEAEGQRVHLASGSHVAAFIKGEEITVDGKVEGDIHATGRLALLQGADVSGDVSAARFDCLSGARLHGKVSADTETG